MGALREGTLLTENGAEASRIDPAPVVASQTARVLTHLGLVDVPSAEIRPVTKQ